MWFIDAADLNYFNWIFDGFIVETEHFSSAENTGKGWVIYLCVCVEKGKAYIQPAQEFYYLWVISLLYFGLNQWLLLRRTVHAVFMFIIFINKMSGMRVYPHHLHVSQPMLSTTKPQRRIGWTLDNYSTVHSVVQKFRGEITKVQITFNSFSSA